MLSKTETFESAALSGPGPAAHLLIVAGTSSSRRSIPHDGSILVGRGAEADVRIDVPSISRRHARFISARGHVEVDDLGSHNGTLVNGEPVSAPRRLGSGDVVTMGEVTFVLRTDRPRDDRVLGDPAATRRRVEDEIERALDVGRPLAVLMIALGTAPVDAGALSARASSCVARSDVLGFLGPAQLVAALPERSADDARAVGAAILEAIAPVAPRAAAGVALCPSDGCDADTLLSGARVAAEKAPPRGIALAADTAVEHVFGGHRVVLADPAMIRLFELIQRLAPTDLPVLILGETGVGKENAALALHHGSRRAQKALVTLNCAAIPDNLVESELFGYEAGAFSDARVAKPGLLEKASGGTLFLDEIGELSERVQAKLLRVLDAKRTMRLGDLREREIDLRVVAATNRDLEAECRARRFREDLFFRLGAASVHLPPLRERPREIPILARRFLAAASEKLGRSGAALSEPVLARLATYPWPGNVRELKNAMEYAAATMAGPRVDIWDLPERQRRASEVEEAPADPIEAWTGPPPRAIPLADELRSIERARIEEALAEAGGVQVRAAATLGMPIRTLTHKLKQYGIQPHAARKRP